MVGKKIAQPKSTYVVEVAPAKPASDGKPTVGPEYRAIIAKDGPPKLENCESLYEMFQQSVEKYADKDCLGARTGANGEYEWISYKEAGERIAAIGSAMAHVGLDAHGRVGVYGANSPEWMLTMQACNRMNLYCVPLYDTLGENAIEYIMKHSESTIAFTQSSKFPMLVKALAQLTPQVKTVVYWGEKNEEACASAVKLGIDVYSFEEFLAIGKENMTDARPPKAQDLCTIMYTSGTTGNPKGVELTHESVLATVASLIHFLNLTGEAAGENEVFFSFLPLAHIFDRTAEEMYLHLGAAIGYWRGDIKGLVEDIGILKPTQFCGVPRVFDRIYAGVMAQVNQGSFLKRMIFNWGYKRKLDMLNAGYSFDTASPFFDKLVFSKIKEKLGGRIRLLVSGGAPLSRHVEDFLKVTMCCHVIQGYGLTETCAGTCICVPDVPAQAGTVGPPQPCVSIRLEAVPEMNYDPLGNPPRGELCIKGPSVFEAYYKEQDKTDEVLESDGWFHSGDIAEMTPEGAIRIIDRKKNIFKLSQGEYVAVEKIEGVYKKNLLVEQIWVYGNSFESSLIAVVVPIEDKLRALAGEHKHSGSFEELCSNKDVTKLVLNSLNATGKEGKLKGFEMVRAIRLETELFSVENDLMTPTFKLKRPQLQQKYQSEIDELYAKMKK